MTQEEIKRYFKRKYFHKPVRGNKFKQTIRFLFIVRDDRSIPDDQRLILMEKLFNELPRVSEMWDHHLPTFRRILASWYEKYGNFEVTDAQNRALERWRNAYIKRETSLSK